MKFAERGTVIYLRASIGSILQRTSHDKNRPLLQTADPRGTLERLLAERASVYALADITVTVQDRDSVEATAGRVPVVAGVSARATRMALDYARRAEDAGVAAVMLAPPDNTKNLELVFQHFRMVADAVSVPVVVQDEPVNTGVTMPAAFLDWSRKRHP